MRFINWLIALVTFQGWRDARRRRRYEELKVLIVKEHMAGRGGMVVPRKYDAKDLLSFKPPMYFHARTETKARCIFWRKDLMTEEVGPPYQKLEIEPLKMAGHPDGYQDDRH